MGGGVVSKRDQTRQVGIERCAGGEGFQVGIKQGEGEGGERGSVKQG